VASREWECQKQEALLCKKNDLLHEHIQADRVVNLIPDCHGSLIPCIGLGVAYPKTAIKQARYCTHRVKVREETTVKLSKFVQRDMSGEAEQPHTSYNNRHIESWGGRRHEAQMVFHQAAQGLVQCA